MKEEAARVAEKGVGNKGKKQRMGQPLCQTHPQDQEGLSGERLE